ncbi:MAG: hypothetical protein HN675_16490 [Opitutae bacterium]|nr:hypothetical protein [Opitutae bacterium]
MYAFFFFVQMPVDEDKQLREKKESILPKPTERGSPDPHLVSDPEEETEATVTGNVRRFPSLLPQPPSFETPELKTESQNPEPDEAVFTGVQNTVPTIKESTIPTPKTSDSNQLTFWGFDEEELNTPAVEVSQIVSDVDSLNMELLQPKEKSIQGPESEITNVPRIKDFPVEESPKLIEVREGGSGTTYFYNIPIRGDKILFLLEASSEMASSEPGGVLSLENELKRVVNSLTAKQKFNIWVFSGDKIARCEPDYMYADTANKVYSLLWLRGHYQHLGQKDIANEDNKPAGYPHSFSSESSLDWASPLFLGLHSYPDEIFLVGSSWQKNQSRPSSLDALRFWTRDKQIKWKDAYDETFKWLEDETRSRKINGLPPRAIISLNPLITKRHPNVEHPPEIIQNSDRTIFNELDGLVHARGLDGRVSLNTILYSTQKDGEIGDIHKFSTLARNYLGRFVLVEKDGDIREF